MPSIWRCLDDNVLVSTRIFDVRLRRFRRECDGIEADFYGLTCGDWVQAIALTPSKEVVLVKQFRFGYSDFFWEIPGGVIDAGETPLEAAVRELQEETGYTGKAPILLASVAPNPAILNNHCHIVLISEAMQTHGMAWDEHEEMECMSVPWDNVWQWVQSGQIRHAIVLSALLHLKLFLDRA